ncbi:MAG TPA: hemolysin family protein [Candidatus Udaeobacter sp.]|jgi:CBS domain containing-hemolysin-like protein|nr:hemolysin family protein [Candidatus Udaeobacter sp.]
MLDLFGVFSVLLLVAANAYFVAAEYALVTVRWTRIEELAGRGNYAARAVQWAIEHKDDVIAATQLGVTLASLGLGWIGEPIIARDLTPLIHRIPLPWSVVVAHGIAIGVAFLAITYLHVVLGELAPKAVALQRAETVALLFTPPLLAFANLTRPLVLAMRKSGAFVVRLMRLPPPTAEQSVHSVEELDMLVEETQEAGVIPADQASYVRNVFELSDKRVRDVMVPKEQVVTLSLRASEDEILETARDTAHTRMPVWEKDTNNIVGIVNTKDLFHLFSLKGLVILMDAMYPAIFVDPDASVARVMVRLRRAKRAMAVVRDRTGQFLGIVTLEDILEEIVGEIEDEHDEPEPPEAQPM